MALFGNHGEELLEELQAADRFRNRDDTPQEQMVRAIKLRVDEACRGLQKLVL